MADLIVYDNSQIAGTKLPVDMRRDDLISCARKIDAANTVELREKFRVAIENSTPMEPADQEAVDRLLGLGDELKTVLGGRYTEFDEQYSKFIDTEPAHWSPAMATLRAMDIFAHASAPLSRGTHLISIQVPESIPPGNYESVLISTRKPEPSVRILDMRTDGTYPTAADEEPSPLNIALPHRCTLGRRVDAGRVVSVHLSVDSAGCANVDFWFLRATEVTP